MDTTQPLTLDATLVLRVNESGAVVGMNENARAHFGQEALHRPCELVMRGKSKTGEPICKSGCAVELASQQRLSRIEKCVRVRQKTVSLSCQRVGDEVVVVAHPSPTLTVSERLTPREREVLTMVGRGQSSAAIAKNLGIATATVRTHVEHALGRLGVRTRAEAVLRAMKTGQLLEHADAE